MSVIFGQKFCSYILSIEKNNYWENFVYLEAIEIFWGENLAEKSFGN